VLTDIIAQVLLKAPVSLQTLIARTVYTGGKFSWQLPFKCEYIGLDVSAK